MVQSIDDNASFELKIAVDKCKFLNAKQCSVGGRCCWSAEPSLISSTNQVLLHVRPKEDVLTLYGTLVDKQALKVKPTSWVVRTSPNDVNDDEGTELILSSRVPLGRTIERNRRGIQFLESESLISMDEYTQDELRELESEARRMEEAKLFGPGDQQQHLAQKTSRQILFAQWLLQTFGKENLSHGSGVLDVAGGKGELSQALLDMQIPSTLVDPNPRCNKETASFQVVSLPLYGDGSELMDQQNWIGETSRNCSMIAGMHPDQATEAIVDMALRLDVSFALLPCCVMPTLFPDRIQKRHGDPVRSYSTFCQYLLDKAPEAVTFQVDYLPFAGRNKIIYYKKAVN